MRRTFCWIGCWVAIACNGAAGAEVTWLHLTSDCPPKPGEITTASNAPAQTLSCGGAGTFVFGTGLSYNGSCGSLKGTTETPAALSAEITPPLPPGFPCAGDQCLGHETGKPWVAVVDWRNEHGWSVAATVREASDQRVGVELFDLQAPNPLLLTVPSVSDLNVLLQLCALAERVQNQPADKPLAVNLSFGRRRSGLFGSGLEGAVGQVLSHLASRGVLPIAAAGNHREMLFPASSPGVIPAGALDLSWFQQGRQSRPSSQTPEGATALALGYGLYLSLDGTDQVWAAPPGSSYAAALLSGWIGGYLAGGGQLPSASQLTGARWAPVATDLPTGPGEGFELALNGAPLAGSDLAGTRRLFNRALYGSGTPRPEATGPVLRWTGTAPPLAPHPILYADAGNDPQPGVCPCVPCDPGGGGIGGQILGEGSGTLVLDLSSSQPLPDGMSLIWLFLRVGKEVYAFDRSGYQDVLAPIAAGTAGSLVLTGLDGLLPPGQQPSLVLQIYVDRLGFSYWHEVPIRLPAP